MGENVMETIHTHFIKGISDLNWLTTKLLAREELGRYLVVEYILVRNIKYIKYITRKTREALDCSNASVTIEHSLQAHRDEPLKENVTLFTMFNSKLKWCYYHLFDKENWIK